MVRGAKTKQSIEKIIIICLLLKFFFCSSMEKFQAHSRYFLYESVRESFPWKVLHTIPINDFGSSERARIESSWNFHKHTMCRSITLLTGKSFRGIRRDDDDYGDDGEREENREHDVETACEEM